VKKQINTIEELLENIACESEKSIEWMVVSICQNFSESFIEKYQDKMNWNLISQYQILSEPFIKKYKDRVNWKFISECQKLSESFIERHKDKVDWNYISQFQILSESFINKHKDKIDINLYNQFHKSFFRKFNEIQEYAEQNNLYHNHKYIYGYTPLIDQNKLINFNKPITYDKINHHYKFHWEKIELNNCKKYAFDKLIKISINDWIKYDFEIDILYIKGFTIINNIPKKQNINKYQLLEF